MPSKNPSKAGRKIESIIDNAVDDFNEGIGKSQNAFYRSLLSLLSQLELNSNDEIKRNANNLRTIRKVNGKLNNELFTKAYNQRLDKYLRSFEVLETELLGYYDKAFNHNGANSFLKTDSIRTTTALLSKNGIDTNFTEPLKRVLNNNVVAGAAYSQMLEEVREFVKGKGGADGRLMRYAKQVTSDGLHVFAGVYNKAIGEELGLKWLKYTGSVIQTTRPFCQARAGKFFKEEEVKSWAGLSWKGRAAGTNETSIFYNVGGYNCRHILIYVDEASIPDYLK